MPDLLVQAWILGGLLIIALIGWRTELSSRKRHQEWVRCANIETIELEGRVERLHAELSVTRCELTRVHRGAQYWRERYLEAERRLLPGANDPMRVTVTNRATAELVQTQAPGNFKFEDTEWSRQLIEKPR